ncbi:MAG: SdiA-regulated domain-containing protein [Bellilinea sp.]
MTGVLLAIRSIAWAAVESRPFKALQTIYTAEFGADFPVGFAYNPSSSEFLVWQTASNPSAPMRIKDYGTSAETADLPTGFADSSAAAFNPSTGRLVWADSSSIQQTIIDNGLTNAVQSHDIRSLAIETPTGLAVDPVNGAIYILDAQGPRFHVLKLGPDGSVIDLATHDIINLRKAALGISANQELKGLAFNPTTHSLFTVNTVQQEIYEISLNGVVLSRMDIGSIGLANIQGLNFAPSSDQTDDPAEQSLFVLDGGTESTSPALQRSGQIVELTLTPTALPVGMTLQAAYMISTFNTGLPGWSPNSPDPAGVEYWPETGGLVISDSEVEEMPVYYQDVNVFFTNLSGVQNGTCDTTYFSTEPSGIALNTANGRLFFSNDDARQVTEINVGPDGIYCTGDDTKFTKNMTGYLSADGSDPEDLAYGDNMLFIAGGGDGEFFWFRLGPDGLLGTVDDGPVNQHDTDALGFSDVEGITYNDVNGTIFIISTAAADRYLGEFSLSGELLNAWDLGFMGTAANIRSGLTLAPGSLSPEETHLYIVSRGIDNDYGVNPDPNEDDGRVWEISLAAPPTSTDTPIPSPTVSETPTETLIPSPTVSVTPTDTVVPSPTVSETPTETLIPSPTVSVTPTDTEIPSPTVSETPTDTLIPSLTASVTPTNTLTPTPTHTPTSPLPEYRFYLPVILN